MIQSPPEGLSSVGITNALRLWAGPAGGTVPSKLNPLPQVEAWTSDHLQAIVWADILGLDALPMTRAEALSVPAIARGVSLLKTTIAKWPLQVLRGDALVEPQPSWCLRTSGPYSWQYRSAWTVDDLIFYGASLWQHARGADNFPLQSTRVPWSEWDVNAAGEIVDADGHPFPSRSISLIPGWHEGIVSFGQRSIRQATALEYAAGQTAAAPFKLELHQSTDVTLTETEKYELLTEARRAMAESGGILFTNSAIEARDHGGAAETLFVESRNSSAVDMARLIGIPAAMIDATSAGTSLQYETVAGRNQQFLDYGTSLYADPIAARLSLDDVVPAGNRTAFDSSISTIINPAATGPATED